MPGYKITANDATSRNLLVLLLIRCVALLGVLTATFWVREIEQLPLPLQPLLSILGGVALVTLLSFARLALRYPVTGAEFMAQLLLDVIGLSLLLYTAGGYTNPFVSYYLVPIAVAATVLSWRAAWSITVLSIAAYTLLMFYYQPLTALSPHMHMQHSSANLHLFGMWFTFVLSAILITYFVVKMANTVRESEQALITHHEKEIRDEHLISLATLAAGTAHELGTPLSSMKVVLHDLLEEDPEDADIALLSQQVSLCQQTLRKLSKVASTSNKGESEILPIKAFLNALLEQWTLLRPDTRLHISWQENCEYEIKAPTSIAHSLMNLLNNAADASPAEITVVVHIDAQQLEVRIQDYGPGIDPAIAEQLGRNVVTTKGGGIGIGLLLTHATINRFGGEVELRRNDQGTLTMVTLPMRELKVS